MNCSMLGLRLLGYCIDLEELVELKVMTGLHIVMRIELLVDLIGQQLGLQVPLVYKQLDSEVEQG